MATHSRYAMVPVSYERSDAANTDPIIRHDDEVAYGDLFDLRPGA